MSGNAQPVKVKRPWWLLAVTGLLGLTVVVLATALVVSLSQRPETANSNDVGQTAAMPLEEQNRELRARLYAANMHLAYKAWEEGNVGLLQHLLKEHRPQPGQEDLRRFEWHYLQRLCHAERLTIREAGDRVVSLAVAPDGRWLAAGCAEGTVTIWTASNGVEWLRWQKHTGPVRGLAFSPDSRQLATGGADGTLQVWDAQSGQLLRTVTTGAEEIRCVAFHPDGKHLAAAVVPLATKGMARSGGRVVVWTEGSSKPLFTSKEWAVSLRKITFNQAGTHLAATAGAQNKGVAVKVWEVVFRPQFFLQEMWALLGEQAPGIFGLAWSPDGAVLASSGVDRKIHCWAGATGKLLRVLEGHQDFVTTVEFSPDGKQLASGGWDQTVRVWDAATGAPLANLRGHVSRLVSVAFLPDGKIVSAAGKAKPQGYEIKVWDAGAGQEVPRAAQRLNNVESLAFRPDGKRLVCGCWESIGELKVWDTVTGTALHTWPGHAGRILGVAYSPDGRRIASAGQDGKVKVWDADTFKSQLVLDGPGRLSVCVAFSPDGRWLIGGGETTNGSGELWRWDLLTGHPQRPLAAHGRGLNSVAFSRDGRRLVTTGSDGHVKVWDASPEAFKELIVYTAEEGQKVFDAVFNAAGTQVASAHWDQTVRVWNSDTGKELLRLKGHVAPVYSVVFHPDGSRLMSRDRRGTIKVWDATTGQELLSVGDREPMRGFGRLALSLDGNLLAVSGGWGTRLRIWDARPLAAE